jgi:hypothetical protein
MSLASFVCNGISRNSPLSMLLDCEHIMRFELESFKYLGLVADNFFLVSTIAELEDLAIKEIRKHSRVTIHDTLKHKTYEILDFHEVFDVLHMIRN